MSRPLDGVALHAYFHRLGFERVTQDLLIHIRNSPPSRTPGARHGNMPVWYPSKKMQCIIKAESAKVEFAFLLQAEHHNDVLEIWDQPPSIPLEYQDKHNRWQRPMHNDTVRRAPKRGAYGEYLKCSEERALKPVSQWTFYLESKRHKPLHEQMLLREGTRAAYPFKDYTREREKTVPRHGSYAWELAHIDHTELDLALCDSSCEENGSNIL
jgi:hypothetical protein